jgi:hypothetical protein
MASVAVLLEMLALQRKPRLCAMIEVFSIQRNEFGFLAAMLRMTARAIYRCFRLSVSTRMKARSCFNSLPDFNVTLQTFQTAA